MKRKRASGEGAKLKRPSDPYFRAGVWGPLRKQTTNKPSNGGSQVSEIINGNQRDLFLSEASPQKARNKKTLVDEGVEYYRLEHPRVRPGKKERQKILERLQEGYTVGDLKDAIAGCHLSPFHRGENPSNRKYLGLELIMRDSEHVGQFIEIYEETRESVLYMFEQQKQKSADQERYRELVERRKKLMRPK